MAYTPINWQTGDTITAEKMNKMDNGWSINSNTTELYSGSITVSAGPDGGAIIPSPIATQLLSAEIAVVTIDSTAYTCDGFDDDGYWTFGAPYGDYSEYPFSVYVDGAATYFTNQSAGTYSIEVALNDLSAEVSSDFSTAATVAVSQKIPMLCESGITTAQDIRTATQSRRLMYFCDADSYCYLVYRFTFTTDTDATAEFYPENSSVSASVINGLFVVTKS